MQNSHSQQLKVALIVPAKKFRCLGGMLWTQRYGPLQVATVVHEAGHFVQVYNEEIGNKVYPQEIALNYDVVGISSKTSAITRAEEIAQQIKIAAKQFNRNIIMVLGGEHASMSNGNRISSDFDYVLPGESELAFLDILEFIKLERQGMQKTFNIIPPKGFYQCETFNNIPDISLVVGYEDVIHGWLFRHLPLIWSIKHKRLPTICFQGTRGCPYNCSFCPTPTYLQGRKYRRRDNESAIKYLKEHISKSGIKRVMFEDPTSAIPFDEESYRFFQSIANSSIEMKATVLVRPDLCQDEKLLEVMKAAGVSNLSIGIESLNDKTLKDFKKKTSLNILERSIEVFHNKGFSVTGLFIAGYDIEDMGAFTANKKFIIDTGIEKWRVSPLGQMPEVPDQFLPTHRAFLWNELDDFGSDLADYMNGEFVIFFPKNMKPSILQKKIEEFNYSSSSWAGTIKLFLKHKRLGPVFQRAGNNIAQKMIQREVVKSNYIQMLDELEQPFYDRHGRNWILREDLLVERYKERLSVTFPNVNDYEIPWKNYFFKESILGKI